MSIANGRFRVDFDEAFPKRMLFTGEISPKTKYDPNAGPNTPRVQSVDEVTGLPEWVAQMQDCAAVKKNLKMLEVTFLSPVQPVPAGERLADGIWLVELENISLSPRILNRNSGFPSVGYAVYATGFKGDMHTPKPDQSANGRGVKAGA